MLVRLPPSPLAADWDGQKRDRGLGAQGVASGAPIGVLAVVPPLRHKRVQFPHLRGLATPAVDADLCLSPVEIERVSGTRASMASEASERQQQDRECYEPATAAR
jgi:hypothetical protein